ncbi:MAG: hypothetical protein AAFW60_08830, partial [Pseudomonadota bacterium]
IVFDNQGGHYRRGGSRIATIDMASGELETLYPTDDVPLDERFYTRQAGHFVLSEDNDRALTSLTLDGILKEVDLRSGEIIWEYENIHDMTDHPDTADDGNLGDFTRFQTGGAYYVDRPTFLDTAASSSGS